MNTPSPFSPTPADSDSAAPAPSPFSATSSESLNGADSAAAVPTTNGASPFAAQATTTSSTGATPTPNGSGSSPFAAFDSQSKASVGANNERAAKIPERRTQPVPTLEQAAIDAGRPNPFQFANGQPQPAPNGHAAPPAPAVPLTPPAQPMSPGLMSGHASPGAGFSAALAGGQVAPTDAASPFTPIAPGNGQPPQHPMAQPPVQAMQPPAPAPAPAPVPNGLYTQAAQPPAQPAAPKSSTTMWSTTPSPNPLSAGTTPSIGPNSQAAAAAAPPSKLTGPVPVAPNALLAGSAHAAKKNEAPPMSQTQAVRVKEHMQGGGSFQQLEIRAIFGVNHDLSEAELLDRARSLVGIRNVNVIQADKVAAVESVRASLAGLGIEQSEDLSLSINGSTVDFVSHGGVTLIVLHEGEYTPGVRETLMIIARALGQMRA